MPQLTLIKPENKITLRDYQQRAYDQIIAKIESGDKRILVNAPCSFGKTALISQVIRYFKEQKKRVLFVVPAISLVSQAQKDFYDAGIQCGIIAGGHKFDNWLTQIASVQALARRKKLGFKPDLVILDECHLTAFTAWFRDNFPLLLNGQEILSVNQLIQYLDQIRLTTSNPDWNTIKTHWSSLKNSPISQESEAKTAYQMLKKYKTAIDKHFEPNQIPILGLTATPWRLQKTESLSDIFNSLIKCETPKQMIDLGYLVECVYYRLKTADLSKIKSYQGDYQQEELSVACSDAEVVKSAVDNYKRICPDRKFICFAVDLKHAKLLSEEFQNQGIKTAVISGDMPDKERTPLKQQLGDVSNDLMGLISVGCISIGFSVPEVSCVILCRPTKSISLYVQQVGRGQRLAPHINKSNCIVLDQSLNTKNFGLIEDLEYPDLGSNEFEIKPSPTKECPDCGLIQPIFNQQCQCGFVFESEVGSGDSNKIRPIGNLEIIIKESDKPVFDYYRKALCEAYQRDYDPDWAKMKTYEKFKKFPHKEWARNSIFSVDTHRLRSIYWNHLTKLAAKLEQKQQRRLNEGVILKRIKLYDTNWKQSHFINEFGSAYQNIRIVNRPDPSLLDLLEF